MEVKWYDTYGNDGDFQIPENNGPSPLSERIPLPGHHYVFSPTYTEYSKPSPIGSVIDSNPFFPDCIYST